MNATIVSVLLGVFLLGVLLVVLGRRGRRLNDHPQCKWCGFDLHGVYPQSVTCPECGAGLKRDGAVRTGVRKRMVWLSALGVLIALLPLAPLATVMYAALTGTNLARYTPTGLLLWETRIASPAANKQIADELIDRLIKKRLDKPQTAAMAERVLAIQGDRSVPWDDVWGDVIERLALNGDLTKEQKDRYHRQAAALTARARAVVRAGDTLPVLVKLDSGRVGGSSQLLATVAPDTVKLGTTVLKKASTGGGGLFGGGGQPGAIYFYLYGGKSNAAWMNNQPTEQVTSVAIPKSTEPGPATLTVTVLSRVNDMQNGWGGGGRLKAGDPGVASFTFTQQITVLPAEAEPVKMLPATPAAEKELRDIFQQFNLQANVAASGSPFSPFTLLTGASGVSISRMVNGQLTFTKPKTPFAFDVYVRLRDKETKIGQVASSPGVQWSGGMYGAYGTGGNGTFYLAAEVRNLQRSDKTVDLILRPSSRAALATTDLVEIYGGEIVLKDFAVTRNAEGADQTVETVAPATSTTSTTSEPATSPEPADKP